MAQRQRVFVTGGTGFTGAHLVRRLLSRGNEVVVVDNQKGMFYDELEHLGAKITVGSVTDQQLMNQLMQGCSVVHHLAAAFREVELPKEVYWDVNVNGTRYLLEAALRNRVDRFVYCSTQGVHGHIDNPPGDETSPIAPADYYQYTKYKGEEVVQEFIQKGLKATILRATAIYGPGDPGRWFILFKRVAPGRFLMFGNGMTHYHPVYIDNLVDAFELAAEKDQAVGQTYIIGDEHSYTLNDLVLGIGKVLDIDVNIVHLPFRPLWLAALACEIAFMPFKVPPPIFRRRVDWFRQNRSFSIAKARRELGYQPRVGLEEGLMETGRWYLREGLLKLEHIPTALET